MARRKTIWEQAIKVYKEAQAKEEAEKAMRAWEEQKTLAEALAQKLAELGIEAKVEMDEEGALLDGRRIYLFTANGMLGLRVKRQCPRCGALVLDDPVYVDPNLLYNIGRQLETPPYHACSPSP
jgi:hypothetical protein